MLQPKNLAPLFISFICYFKSFSSLSWFKRKTPGTKRNVKKQQQQQKTQLNTEGRKIN